MDLIDEAVRKLNAINYVPHIPSLYKPSFLRAFADHTARGTLIAETKAKAREDYEKEIGPLINDLKEGVNQELDKNWDMSYYYGVQNVGFPIGVKAGKVPFSNDGYAAGIVKTWSELQDPGLMMVARTKEGTDVVKGDVVDHVETVRIPFPIENPYRIYDVNTGKLVAFAEKWEDIPPALPNTSNYAPWRPQVDEKGNPLQIHEKLLTSAFSYSDEAKLISLNLKEFVGEAPYVYGFPNISQTAGVYDGVQSGVFPKKDVISRAMAMHVMEPEVPSTDTLPPPPQRPEYKFPLAVKKPPVKLGEAFDPDQVQEWPEVPAAPPEEPAPPEPEPDEVPAAPAKRPRGRPKKDKEKVVLLKTAEKTPPAKEIPQIPIDEPAKKRPPSPGREKPTTVLPLQHLPARDAPLPEYKEQDRFRERSLTEIEKVVKEGLVNDLSTDEVEVLLASDKAQILKKGDIDALKNVSGYEFAPPTVDELAMIKLKVGLKQRLSAIDVERLQIANKNRLLIQSDIDRINRVTGFNWTLHK